MEIIKNTVVSLRYIMRNNQGEEIENPISGPAVQYIHGTGKILRQLETLLTGLKTGDKKQITLKLPDTFHFDMEIDAILMATRAKIATGKPTTVNDCGPGCSCQ